MRDIYKTLLNHHGKSVDCHLRRALSQWYFMLQQDLNDPLLFNREVGSKHEANKKLIQTINENKIFSSHEIPIDEYLWDSIETSRRKNFDVPLTPRWNDMKQQIEFNDFFIIYHDKLDSLRKHFKCDDVLLARATLHTRNDLMNYSGFRSSERKDLIHLLYERFDVRFEGFASVLDSVLLHYADTKWCSLFDVDKQFQSLGNFFHLDLTRKEYQGSWFLNAPYVESIIDDMTFKILHSLRFGQVESCFFITIPTWNDTWAWKNLRNSRFLLAVMDDVPLLVEWVIRGKVQMVASKTEKRCFIILGHPKFARDDFDRIERVLRNVNVEEITQYQ